MPELNSAEYYQGHERTERAFAEAATNPHIAAIHREMADSYRELTGQATFGGHRRPERAVRT